MLLHGRWCALGRWKGIQQSQRSGDTSGLPGKPKTLLEVLGKNRLIIEHHRGISCYAPEEIWVKTTFGQLQIRGADLRLCCMSRQQLCILGRIDALELIGRESHGSVE